VKVIVAPEDYAFPEDDEFVPVIAYGRPSDATQGSVGAALKGDILRAKLSVAPRAWDLLTIAMAVAAADLAGHRQQSPNGWTRDFDLEIAVADPVFWSSQRALLAETLSFLSTDIWRLDFLPNGVAPVPPAEPNDGPETAVVLLSGGLDSLTGAIDLAAGGAKLVAVSHLVRGDAEKQEEFARAIGGGLRHIQLNHNAQVPDPESPPTQRARSLAFLAYGVAVASATKAYRNGATTPLYICENGFIAINPALTNARIGSLSTRTAHPRYLRLLQRLLDNADLRVAVSNPCALMTKGEMLRSCRDQSLLQTYAGRSTSCGRFLRYGYRHCGRCVPCQIRRAAFLAWGQPDPTTYVYEDIGKKDDDHAGFDDVRAMAMAIADVQTNGVDAFLAGALNTAQLGNVDDLKDVVGRGLLEVKALHDRWKVR